MSPFTPPQKPYAGYLFDCDGTLADTMPLHYHAWTRAVAEQGVDIDYTVDLFYSMAGMSVQDTIQRLNERFQVALDPKAVQAVKDDLYACMLEHVKPIQPVVDFCLECLHRGDPVAVVSGSSRVDVDATLDAVGLGPLIRTRVCQGDTDRGKPDTQPFEYAAKLLGVSLEKCLIIEDSTPVIQAAQKAGIDTLYVPNRMQ